MTTVDPRAGAAPTDTSEMAALLEAWWMQTSQDDLMATVPKAVEYSSSDLNMMGGVLANLLDLGHVDGNAEIELATLVYIQGKVARAIGAFKDGRAPSADTYHDITVYSMIARRAREAGGWPGA